MCSEFFPNFFIAIESLLECKKCKRKLRTTAHLNEHMLMHDGDKPFQCTKCTASFYSESLLKQHFFTHTDQYQCGKCYLHFKHALSLEKHLKLPGRCKGLKYKCLECNEICRSQRSYNNHREVMHPDSLKCETCHIKFTTVKHLNKHKKTHLVELSDEDDSEQEDKCINGDTNEQCPDHIYYPEQKLDKQPFVFDAFESKSPKLDQNLESKFTCKLCQSEFTSQFFLQFHMKITHERRCSTHNYGSMDWNAFKPKQNESPRAIQPANVECFSVCEEFECGHLNCGLKFNSKADLIEHVSKHQIEEMYNELSKTHFRLIKNELDLHLIKL